MLYLLLAGLVLPRVLRIRAEKHLAALTGAEVHIAKITFNPFILRLSVDGFSLRESQDKPLLEGKKLVVDLELASLWKREVRLSEISLDHPRVQLHRSADGTVNLLTTIDRVQNSIAASNSNAVQTSRSTLPFFISQLWITNGEVFCRDEAVIPAFEAALPSMELRLQNVSMQTGTTASVTFSTRGDQNEQVTFAGSLQLNPVQIDARLAVSDVALSRFRAYLEPTAAWTPTSGVVSLEIPFTMQARTSGITAAIEGGRVAVERLTLIERTNSQPVLLAENIEVQDVRASTEKKDASVGGLNIRNGSLQVRRMPSGETNVRGIIPPESIEAMIRNLTDWKFHLQKCSFDGLSLTLADQSVEPPAQLSIAPLALKLENISNDPTGPPSQLALTAQWCDAGEIQVNARSTISPMRAEGDIQLKQLTLLPLHPYISPFARLTLSRGFLTAGLRVDYGRDTNHPSLVRAQGNLLVTNLAAIDAANGTDFIRWDAVELNGLNVGLEPNNLSLDSMIARQVQTSLIVNSNGQINVLQILQRADASEPKPAVASDTAEESTPAPTTVTRSDSPQGTAPEAAEAAATASAAATTWPIAIGTFRVEGLSLVAADRFYGNGFHTTVESIDGEVRNFSFPARGPADIDLKGRLTALSGFTLSGQVHPDSAALKADLRLTTQKAELAQFAPYSVRFAGYPITRGNLTADIRYKVEEGQLEASNDLLIDQFTLGAKTNSPDAINIPLKLGVALLKDREGRIHLNVPLTGSLQDPQFKLGPIIWQAVRNILLKAVTAPFALLGSLFGSKEDLQYVEFDPGSFIVAESQSNRLATLRAALLERPHLQLEVLPAFDPAADRAALAKAKIEKELTNLRLDEYATFGTGTTEVNLTAEDRARLLPRAFAKRFGTPAGTSTNLANPTPAAPATVAETPPPAPIQLGSPPGPALSVAEMERRLVETTRVEPQELVELAAQRALSVQKFLTQAPALDAQRVLIVSDDPDNPGEGKSRVTFRLQ